MQRLARVRVDLGELRRTRQMPGGRHRSVLEAPTVPLPAVPATSHAAAGPATLLGRLIARCRRG